MDENIIRIMIKSTGIKIISRRFCILFCNIKYLSMINNPHTPMTIKRKRAMIGAFVIKSLRKAIRNEEK
jgi:hypothetical protein